MSESRNDAGIVIDAAQYANWNRDIFLQMREGGATCVNVTIAYWESCRETALARVRSLPRAEPARTERFKAVLARARAHVREWRVEDEHQPARLVLLG